MLSVCVWMLIGVAQIVPRSKQRLVILHAQCTDLLMNPDRTQKSQHDLPYSQNRQPTQVAVNM